MLTIVICALSTGCVKDNPSMENFDLLQLENTHITIDELTAFITQNYKDNQTVVFSNETGEEARYTIDYSSGNTTRSEFGINYTHDFFVIRLNSLELPNTDFEIRGQGLYTEKGETQKSISVLF